MSGLGERTNLFSGSANPILAQRVAAYLNTSLGKAEITKFSDGEVRVEIHEHVRGHHIFIIQPTCAPTNDHIMELLVMVDAFRRSAVKSITAVIPYYGYSRQDRRPDFTRTPITSRLVADMLETAGVDQVVIVDLHSGQQQGFFHVPVINISASPEIVGDIWRRHAHRPKDLVVVSPDTGGVVRARSVAKQLDNAELAIIDKRRPSANKAEVMHIIGDVEGKRCIVVDDMIDTAGTLCKGAEALKDRGADFVAAYATHAVFSGPALSNIANPAIDEVVVTDTIPTHIPTEIASKVRVISVAGLLAETLRRLRLKESISEMYVGH